MSDDHGLFSHIGGIRQPVYDNEVNFGGGSNVHQPAGDVPNVIIKCEERTGHVDLGIASRLGIQQIYAAGGSYGFDDGPELFVPRPNEHVMPRLDKDAIGSHRRHFGSPGEFSQAIAPTRKAEIEEMVAILDNAFTRQVLDSRTADHMADIDFQPGAAILYGRVWLIGTVDFDALAKFLVDKCRRPLVTHPWLAFAAGMCFGVCLIGALGMASVWWNL